MLLAKPRLPYREDPFQMIVRLSVARTLSWRLCFSSTKSEPGSTMDAEYLRSRLEAAGEIMVNVEEFDVPIELHLHDTEISEDTVKVELTDGELEFSIDRITGAWKHYHSTEDYGIH